MSISKRKTEIAKIGPAYALILLLFAFRGGNESGKDTGWQYQADYCPRCEQAYVYQETEICPDCNQPTDLQYCLVKTEARE